MSRNEIEPKRLRTEEPDIEVVESEIPMVLRTTEREQLRDHVRSLASGKSKKQLFLTGGPGTGKTLSVGCVLNCLRKSNWRVLNLNANVFIDSELTFEKHIPRIFNLNMSMSDYFIDSNKRARKEMIYVLVIDEIDRLISKGKEEEILDLFALSRESLNFPRKFFVICMANDFELPSSMRELTRKFVYAPYSSQDLSTVLAFLSKREGVQVDATALKLISMKSKTGDAREAWSLLTKAELSSSGGNNTHSSSHVKLSNVSTATREIGSEDLNVLKSLPPQCLNVLCIGLGILWQQRRDEDDLQMNTSIVKISELKKEYKHVMRSYSLPLLADSDFYECLTTLESNNLIIKNGSRSFKASNGTANIIADSDSVVKILDSGDDLRRRMLKGLSKQRSSVNMYRAAVV